MVDCLRLFLLLLGAVPLFVYPAAAVASLMGLASESTVRQSLFNRVISRWFLWGVLLYPCVYTIGYLFSDSDTKYFLVTASLPLIYLLFLWGIFRCINTSVSVKK